MLFTEIQTTQWALSPPQKIRTPCEQALNHGLLYLHSPAVSRVIMLASILESNVCGIRLA